jgi:hypothetical protein
MLFSCRWFAATLPRGRADAYIAAVIAMARASRQPSAR